MTGRNRLVASYAKIRAPLTEYEKGLCVWNEDLKRFEKLKTIWKQKKADEKPPAMPYGHPVHWEHKVSDRRAFAAGFFSTFFSSFFSAFASSATFSVVSSAATSGVLLSLISSDIQ